MRIYAASLTDYNGGILHGVWIDVEDADEDEINEQIQEMLKTSPTAAKNPYLIAEEWAIHDHEGFPRCMGEYPAIEDIVSYCETVNDLSEDAVRLYVEYHGDFSLAHEASEKFSFGPKENMREVGEAMYEYNSETEIGVDIAMFVDWEAFAERGAYCQEYIVVGNHSTEFYAFSTR